MVEELTADEWMKKGELLEDFELYEEAIDCYNKALEIDPTYAMSWLSKGGAFIGLSRFEKAIGCFDKILEFKPRNAFAWFSKGYSYYKMERYEEALKCYDIALEIDSNFTDAKEFKSKATKKFNENTVAGYEQSGNYEKAIEINEELELLVDVKRCGDMLDNINTEDLDVPQSSVDTESIRTIGNSITTDYNASAIMIKSESENDSPKKMFKRCPYCGEQLNFPKPPKFCPYCEEQILN